VIQTVGVEPNASINEFDKAIAEFATAYVDQTEGDWRAFVEAIKADRISASTSGYSNHPARAGSSMSVARISRTGSFYRR